MAYLSKEFLHWYAYTDSGHEPSQEVRQRGYEIWNHADSQIKSESSLLQLADGISNLKRCLNQRLKAIEAFYFIRSVPVKNLPKGYLQLLGALGIVRPFMLEQLMDIRNEIEHEDAPPPPYVRARELLDMTWYFLRSTEVPLKT